LLTVITWYIFSLDNESEICSRSDITESVRDLRCLGRCLWHENFRSLYWIFVVDT
jgi:hypothetical protein